MICKLCNDNIHNGSLFHYLFVDDNICYKCRKSWLYKPIKFKVDNYKAESFYLYHSGFKDAIIQYKECYDEYLSDIFIYKFIQYINVKYYGYSIVLAPSSKEAYDRRGFNHLKNIFKHTSLPIVDILEKTNDVSQKTLSLKQRTQVNNVQVKKGSVIPKKILLVDDVYISGNTMKNCLNVINSNNNNIKLIIISHNLLANQ